MSPNIQIVTTMPDTFLALLHFTAVHILICWHLQVERNKPPCGDRAWFGQKCSLYPDPVIFILFLSLPDIVDIIYDRCWRNKWNFVYFTNFSHLDVQSRTIQLVTPQKMLVTEMNQRTIRLRTISVGTFGFWASFSWCGVRWWCQPPYCIRISLPSRFQQHTTHTHSFSSQSINLK